MNTTLILPENATPEEAQNAWTSFLTEQGLDPLEWMPGRPEFAVVEGRVRVAIPLQPVAQQMSCPLCEGAGHLLFNPNKP